MSQEREGFRKHVIWIKVGHDEEVAGVIKKLPGIAQLQLKDYSDDAIAFTSMFEAKRESTSFTTEFANAIHANLSDLPDEYQMISLAIWSKQQKMRRPYLRDTTPPPKNWVDFMENLDPKQRAVVAKCINLVKPLCLYVTDRERKVSRTNTETVSLGEARQLYGLVDASLKSFSPEDYFTAYAFRPPVHSPAKFDK